MRPHTRVASALSVSLLLVALSGCRSTSPASTAASATATTQPTAATQPTVTLAPLPKLPTTQITSGVCGQYYPSAVKLTPAGGLVVTQYSGLGNLAYPVVQIPSSQPAKPIPAPPIIDQALFTEATVVENPKLHEAGGGYVIVVCNPTSQAHKISAVQVSIASISLVTSATQTWQQCSSSYIPGSGVVGGGCGGADFENEYMHAAFAPDAQVGASTVATQTGSNVGWTGANNYGPLPVTLQPGQTLWVEVGVTQPSVAGYYTYAFGLTVDGTATGVVAYSVRTLFDPHPIEWSGQNCLAAAFQSQIAQMPTPTTNSAGYICPAS